VWDAEALRDDLTRYVVENLGEAGGVLIIDETGFLKKGDKSVGVKRQYSGTAGGVENCQVGVFLAYATQKGHTFLDRALYLPEEWADDAARREIAKVPEEIAFATKPYLAQQMLARAFAAGVPAAWVTADSVYGGDLSLRAFLEERRQAYVLALACDERLDWEQGRIRAQTLADRLPASRWQTLSAGAGEKGPRLYDWACLLLDAPKQAGFGRWLLVRRSLSDPSERAYYLVFAPAETPLQTKVKVAGTRWCIEVGLEAAKGEVGLDAYEVRSFHGWYRHITLSLLAHAFLSVMRAQQSEPTTKGGKTIPRNSLREFKQSRGLGCP
jgi:SRSO17 transposase